MPITTCPECHSAMEVIPRGDILIDVCPSCRGVWLDGGELEKLLIQTRQHEAERLENESAAMGLSVSQAPAIRAPKSRSKKGKKDEERGKEKKRKKKKGFFDIGDFGDLLEDLFD